MVLNLMVLRHNVVKIHKTIKIAKCIKKHVSNVTSVTNSDFVFFHFCTLIVLSNFLFMCAS